VPRYFGDGGNHEGIRRKFRELSEAIAAIRTSSHCKDFLTKYQAACTGSSSGPAMEPMFRRYSALIPKNSFSRFLAQVRPVFLQGAHMFTESALRNRWIVVPLIVSACFVASIWVGADLVDFGRSKNTGLRNSLNGLPDNDSVAIGVSNRIEHYSEPAVVCGGDRLASDGPGSGFSISAFSFRTPQWPQQSAGAYRSSQDVSGVAPAVRLFFEKGLSLRSLTSRSWQEADTCRIPEIDEIGGMSSSEQFRWNAIYQSSPSSQGSVLVNF
jgi:hypothetical protein